ncbi:MAG: hypothetical protein KH811_09745 [Veillonella sp.]|nr:hypothetical protein [Veillonella sp.]
MAETKKKQKCNINIIKVTKNSDEDRKLNHHIIQVVVKPEHDGGGRRKAVINNSMPGLDGASVLEFFGGI